MATFDEMAPWEALRWFDTPTEALVAGNGNTVQLAPVEPRRVALLISTQSGGQGLLATTDPSTPTGKGLACGGSLPPIALFASTHGPLVQMAWFAKPAIGVNVTVFQVLLRDWPIPDKTWWENYLAPHEK